MSKILLKVLDKVIFPSATLVVSKVFGLYLATQIYSLDWYVKNYSAAGSIFSVRFIFENPEAAMIVNTVSNFFMYLMMLAACGFILVRAYYLHTTHQSPRVVAKLAKVNMLHWVSDTQDILTDAFVWYTALWISTVVCIYAALSGNAYIWIAPVSFVISIIASTALISDLDKEVDYQPGKKVHSN